MAPKQRPSKAGSSAGASEQPAGGSRKERRKAGSKSQVGWSPLFLVLVVAGPLLAASALAALAHFNRSSPPPPAVTPLTEVSFKEFVTTRPEGVLVDFYTESCPHCQKLAPDFEAAAKVLASKGGPAFASLDGNAEPGIAKKYEVNRYPTVLWFRKGENVQELPPQSRSAEKIVEFVKWAGQPAIVELGSLEDLTDALPQLRNALGEKSPPVILGTGAAAYDVLEAAAERSRGKTVFLFVSAADEADSEAGEAPALRAYGREEGDDKVYDGPLEQDAVLKWVQSLVQSPKK